MEPKGFPDDVGKLTHFLQTSLIRLGSVLCVWGTEKYTGTGFRNHPYLIPCVYWCASLCLYSNHVCVLTRLPCTVDLIKPPRPHSATDPTLVLLLYELCSRRCFHHGILSMATDISIMKCTIPVFLERAAGRNLFSSSLFSLIQRLRVITRDFHCCSLLLIDTTQEWVNLCPPPWKVFLLFKSPRSWFIFAGKSSA